VRPASAALQSPVQSSPVQYLRYSSTVSNEGTFSQNETNLIHPNSKHFYRLYRTLFPLVPALTVGSPTSSTPIIKRTGCKFCVPVLWYPAHCELRNHLSKWMPPDFAYCMNCKLFTQASTYSDRNPWRRFCGKCGEDFGSQLSICRERLQETEPGETRWPRYYGERCPPSSDTL
jgi:hypothetical protein